MTKAGRACRQRRLRGEETGSAFVNGQKEEAERDES